MSILFGSVRLNLRGAYHDSLLINLSTMASTPQLYVLRDYRPLHAAFTAYLETHSEMEKVTCADQDLRYQKHEYDGHKEAVDQMKSDIIKKRKDAELTLLRLPVV